jgi:hypothetical protein
MMQQALLMHQHHQQQQAAAAGPPMFPAHPGLAAPQVPFLPAPRSLSSCAPGFWGSIRGVLAGLVRVRCFSCSARVDVALILGYAVQMRGIRLLRCVLGFSVSWVLVVSERARAGKI